MGIFDDIEDLGSGILKPIKKPAKSLVDAVGLNNILTYGPAIAMGAGFGALAGLPAGGVGAIPGAFIGAGTAAASTYAGPKVAKGVKETTGSDFLGTAAEFGVYGLGGGMGLGNAGSKVAARTAGKLGFEKLMAHAALKSSLELGALSGVGAAGGQALAEQAGLPGDLGLIGGGILTPLAGPMAFQKVRGAAYRSDTPWMKNASELFGANEQNSLKRARVMDTGKAQRAYTHEDMVRTLRTSIEGTKARLERYAPEQTEPYFRLATGGFNEAELATRARGRQIPEVREIVTKPYLRAQSSLKQRNAAIVEAQAKLEATVAQHGDLAAQFPAGEGEIANIDGAYIWKSGGVEKAIPDDIYLAHEAVRIAQRNFDESAGKLKTLLGVEEIPPDIEAQRLLLRDKMIPDYSNKLTETQRQLAEMLPEEAAERLQTGLLSKAEFAADRAQKAVTEGAKAAREEAFLKWAQSNPHVVVPPSLIPEAARRFEAVQHQLDIAATHGARGYTKAREPMESFNDYVRAGLFAQKSIRRQSKAAQFIKGWIVDSPRGQVYFTPKGGAGGITPVQVVEATDADLAKGMVKIRDMVNAYDSKTGESKGPMGPFGARDDVHPVKFEDLSVRYLDEQQLTNRNAELDFAAELGRKTAKTPDAREALNAERKSLREAFIGEDEHITAEQMASDLDAVRKSFADVLAPTSADPLTGTRYVNAEHHTRMINGWKSLQSRGIKQNATKANVEKDVQALIDIQRSFDEQLGDFLSVDDVGLLDLNNALPKGDPLSSIFMMAGKSPTDYLQFSDGGPKVWGPAKQFMKRTVIGEHVQSSRGRGLLFDHFGNAEAHATTAGALWNPLWMEADNIAAKLLNEATGAVMQSGAAGKAFTSTIFKGGFHPGRAMKAAVSEMHPISHEGALQKLMEREVDWNHAPAALKKSLETIGKEFPEHLEATKAALLRDPRLFLGEYGSSRSHEYLAMFPKLAVNEDFKRIRMALAALEERQSAGGRLIGVSPDAPKRQLLMKIEPQYRSYIDLDAIKPISLDDETATITNPGALALELLRAMKTKGDTRSITEALLGGREAAMAGPVALYEAMNIHETVAKMAKMSNRPVSRDDIVLKGGQWSVNSRNKWDPELAKDLGSINDIISGNHQWVGLQRMSQQIAMGNLAADLSLFGIQGYKFLAHSLLAGHIFDAPKHFAGLVSVNKGTGNVVKKTMDQVTTHIMSDWGFYSWLRQNLDEVQYLTANGLTGGLKGYISGPDIRKLPLESLPIVGKSFVGKGMSAIRQGTDLQFNRQLFYWKVQGIREHLEVAKTLRTLGRDFTERYVKSSEGLNTIVEDMGGMDGYLYGEKEDVVKAVIRQVNRSYGGVSMNAEGIGVDRQALEQIMLIVPGFFRAQVGQWASVITKPHTLEGQLALTMLGREYLFAASVVSGLSRLMGTSEDVNFDDVTKPTWLALPLPDGNNISILPTMALPRLASRVVKNAVQAASGEQSLDPTIALESFARGRLSPMVSAAYDNLTGEDFLGRKYDSMQEKWGTTLAQLTLPIIGSSLVEDLKEASKGSAAGLPFNWQDVAQNSLVNLVGKSQFPSSPRVPLDKAAQAKFGTDWALLTDAEKREMRKDPQVTAAEAQYDFYSKRRAGSEDQQIDQAYDRYGKFQKEIWEEPQMINGQQTTQATDDNLLLNGQLPGEVWRERYQMRQYASATHFKELEASLRDAGLDPDAVREKKMKRLREGRDPGDIAWLAQQAKTEYAGVEPDTEDREIPTPSGVEHVGIVDWDAFREKREAVLAKYPAAVAERVRQEDQSKTPGIEAYKLASQKQQDIESLPRYRGFTAEQGEKIDQVRTMMAKTAENIKGQMGLPAGTPVPGLAAALRAQTVKEMQAKGAIKTPEDMQLAMFAIGLEENPKLAESLKNPAQYQAILENPDVAIFYPYLRYRVPKALWSRLPKQVFSSPQAQAELAGG